MSTTHCEHDSRQENVNPHSTLTSLLSTSNVRVSPEFPLAELLPALGPRHSSLSFHTSHLSSIDVSLLTEFITVNKHVTHLSFAHVSLGDNAAIQVLSAIASAAHSQSPLLSLSLRSVGISTSGAKRIADVIRDADFGRLENIDLSNNHANWLGERAMEKALASRVLKGRKALDIDISGNRVIVEWLNALTHGFGAIAALIGGILLTGTAVRHGLPGSNIASLAVFAMSLFTLLSSSCIYHSAFRCPAASKKLRKADHCSIFVLIAGSYTPFVVCYTLDPPTFAGPATLLAVWFFAAIGIARSLAASGSNAMRALLALATGWIGVFSMETLVERMQQGALNSVVMGGIAYSVGILFYLLGKKVPILHVVWHVSVMLGGGLHYFALWRYVVHG